MDTEYEEYCRFRTPFERMWPKRHKYYDAEGTRYLRRALRELISEWKKFRHPTKGGSSMETFTYELWSEDGIEFHREFTVEAENLDKADEQALPEKDPNESLLLTGFTRDGSTLKLSDRK